MNTDSQIWFAFARTFAMLFLVLALLVLIIYLMKRLSAGKGMSDSGQLIKVLATHHISPKEKLLLVNVLEKTLLIGVTPTHISRISELEKDLELPDKPEKSPSVFSKMFTQALGASSGRIPGKAGDKDDSGNRMKKHGN